MKLLRALRTAVAATAVSAALTLGLAAPAHAANVDWDCGSYPGYWHLCGTYTGTKEVYYSGQAGLVKNSGRWEVVNQPDSGFTLVLRVWPDSTRSIDYPASTNGRILSYNIYAIQIVVVGHETSNRIFVS
ncbi:hypothetical protein [Actinoplanes aureus]|jgi:hypothetical protein|uniref:Uncharacterized protein n=1 Tax=Actinoplanes aureus TaxID=2792083 RepID=A0A931C5E5_9ACTN|nr:hypothetical protein [Actinoplanes aureus]MBG0563724.1 hypothetical protein [Actinoplanes aureus]